MRAGVRWGHRRTLDDRSLLPSSREHPSRLPFTPLYFRCGFRFFRSLNLFVEAAVPTLSNGLGAEHPGSCQERRLQIDTTQPTRARSKDTEAMLS